MTGAGTEPGWTRLALAVAEQVPPAEVDGVWLFSPLRHEGREWGTAVLSRVDGDRRRIYTARYVLAIRGKERGKFEYTILEVGSGPVVFNAIQLDLEAATGRDVAIQRITRIVDV